MNIDDLLEVAKKYNVVGINYSGCIHLQSMGFRGAMRRKAHAHCDKEYKYYGWICFLSPNPYKRALSLITGRPTKLFWHEVGHIFLKTYSQKRCDRFAEKQVRLFREIREN
jgi:hypothetical protein